MQNSAYSPVRRSWPQREDVFTTSIEFGGKLGGWYFHILLILTVLSCSFFYCTDIIRPFCGIVIAIQLLAEQILVSTLYCLLDIIIQVHPPNVVLFYLCSGTAPTCAARLDRYLYPRFLVDLAFGVDGVRWQFARTATPYRSLLRKSLPYRRGTRSGR